MPTLSRLRRLLASTAVVAGCIGGGSLECHQQALSPVEQQGKDLYGRMCVVCHGRRGEGYKADQAPAIGSPAFLGAATDAYLRHAIINGRYGTTMSAWSTSRGGPLSPTDVEALLAFLKTWSRGPRPDLDESPVNGDTTRGKAIFDRECVKCHGVRGTTGPNVHIGGREILQTASNGFLRLAIRQGRPKTTMPGFEAALGQAGVEDVLAYIRSFETPPTPPPALPPTRPPPIPLGPVPLNPKGPEPQGFQTYPGKTPADVVKAQLDRHAKMAILDARAPSDYTNEHIAGAVSVPFYDPAPYVDKLPKNAWLVAYCACPSAESGMLAAALQAKGFTKVTILAEGIGVWRTKQYGTSKGTSP